MRRASALIVAGLASPAAAEPASTEPPPDPAAQRAADANLVSLDTRRGLIGGVMLGPSMTLGSGNGNGGAISLRLGHVATPTTSITFELDGTAQLHRTGMGTTAETYANSITSLLVGAQLWVAPSLYVRAAGGLGVYTCTKLCSDADQPSDSVTRQGPAGAIGIGVDVARFKGLVLAIEVSSVNQLNRNGMLSTNAIGFGLMFD